MRPSFLVWLVCLFNSVCIVVCLRVGGRSAATTLTTLRSQRSGLPDVNCVLAEWAAKTDSWKCPFIRANTYKVIDSLQAVLGDGSVSSAKEIQEEESAVPPSIDTIAERLLKDWKGLHNPYEGRGYYVTGAMTRSLYQPDCCFDGPEPDMPVNGLSRFQRTVEQLFDQNSTRADLTRPLFVYRHLHTIKAYWRMEGRMHLPWLPKLKPWTGSTTYIINPATGRICKHIEKWDISVCDAFLSTLLPCIPLGKAPAPPLEPAQLEAAQHIMYIE